MTTTTVGNTAALQAAVGGAKAGDTILLTAGTYAGVVFKNLPNLGGVTITSADPGAPATITGLTITNVSGLTFSGVNFSIVGFPVGKNGSNATWPFRVENHSSAITFDHVAMSGDPNGTLANTVCGILVEDSTHVSVTNSTFDHIHTALQFLNSSSVNVSGNSFQYIYDDGVDFAATSDVTVANNNFTSFHWDATDTQHPDCIQFYSLSGQTTIPTNISITGNVYTRGDGAPVHGIFMHDTTKLQSVPFTNVLISGNSLTGAQANGIVVDGGASVSIENNTVVSYADQRSWIEVSHTTGADVSGNAAAQYVFNSSVTTTTPNVTNALQPLPDANKITPVSITVSGDGVDAKGMGHLGAGKTVTITVTANERLWVTDPSSATYLVLNSGGLATYVGGQGTRTLTFSYTVGATDNAKALAVTGINGTITDATIDPSNPANGLLDYIDHQLLAPDLKAPGLAPGLEIDTTAPTVIAASATPVPPGGAAVITIDASETVNATGSTLKLSDGGTATFDAANSTQTHLVYKYTVPADDAPLSQVTVTAVNGVTDLAGNALSYSGSPSGPLDVTCFWAGVLIATPDGARPVESLRAGDLVLTHDGRQAPILWLGRQTISRTFADLQRVAPIRIRAGALGEQRPGRDLLVSPCHALLVDDLLVQAGALVNGVSILQERDIPERFTYFHIELAEHDLVLAEGIPAETFIDNADRLGFDNWEEHRAQFPEGRAMGEIDLPRVSSVRQLPQRIQHALAEWATRLTHEAAQAA